MVSLLAPVPIAIVAAVLLLSLALFVLLQRQGKPIQAILSSAVLLAVFFGVLHYGLSSVYSLTYRDNLLIMHTPLGVEKTVCRDLEFLISRYRGSCTIHAYRADEEVFHSVGLPRPRCSEVEDQLRKLPCKQSDRTESTLKSAPRKPE